MNEKNIKRDVSSLFTCCKIFDTFPFVPFTVEVVILEREGKKLLYYMFLSNEGDFSLISSSTLKPICISKLNFKIKSLRKFTDNSIILLTPEGTVKRLLFDGETVLKDDIDLDNVVLILSIPKQDSAILINESSTVFKLGPNLKITQLFDAQCGNPVSATVTTNQIIISSEKLIIGSILSENDFSTIDECESYKNLITSDDNLIYAIPFGRAVVSLTIGEKSLIRKEDILPLKSDEVVDATMIAPGIFAFVRSVTKDVHICCGPAQRSNQRGSPAPRPMMRCNVKSFPVSSILALGDGIFVLGARDGTCFVCRFAKNVVNEDSRSGIGIDSGRIVCRFTRPGGARDETELQPRFNHHDSPVQALASGGNTFVSLGTNGSAVLWEDLPEWWEVAKMVAPFHM